MDHVEWTDLDSVKPLATKEFDQIRELAYRTFGLDLREGKRELVSARLRKLVRQAGHQTYQDYYRHVLSDRTGQALASMIDALTTNHTSFLREADHFRFLKEQVLPGLSRRPRVDVWSAACSTGEEVWTLAFLLHDSLQGRNFRIVGSDISNRVLAKAKDAVYPSDRLTGLPPAWARQYLERGEGEWKDSFRVIAALRAKTEFRRLNLIEPINWPQPFPVIFCRNVMIYFDKPTQEKVVTRLAGFLEPGGHLFVGHAESLAGVRHELEYVRPAVYRKPAARGGK
jgi:chemotaxis protein methyltransferase CheR